jgi:hypothetical protein
VQSEIYEKERELREKKEFLGERCEIERPFFGDLGGVSPERKERTTEKGRHFSSYS